MHSVYHHIGLGDLLDSHPDRDRSFMKLNLNFENNRQIIIKFKKRKWQPYFLIEVCEKRNTSHAVVFNFVLQCNPIYY